MSAGYLKKCSSRGRPKKRHDTREQAEQQRMSLIRMRKWTWAGSNTYWCGNCSGWHAGSLGRANRGGGKRKNTKVTPRWDCQ